MTNTEYWFWLCNIQDMYQDTIEKLIQVFHEPEEIYKATEEDLVRSGAVTRNRARTIVMSKNNFRSSYRLEKLNRSGVRFIHYGSPDYPEGLLALEDKPYSLYVKGNLPDPDLPIVSIVGARNCSGYGKEMTMRFSGALASGGAQIISGMALGVDSYAAVGALEAGGKTFAILGSGLDVIYPRENIELYYRIVLNGGGIISEYPMGTPPIGWHFPHRNRIISAMADKLLIMEARKCSGTLSTASHALAQGKDIYALPGRITDPLSEGCIRLIADGAGVLTNPEDLLAEIFGRPYAGFHGSFSNGKAPKLSDPGARIYEVLDYEPKMISQIADESQIPVDKVAAILTEMELQGICTQVSKDYYTKGT